MKKFYCHPALFKSLLISVDQLTISEGEDSFTIDVKSIPIAMSVAESYDAEIFLAKLWDEKNQVQVFSEKMIDNKLPYYGLPKLIE